MYCLYQNSFGEGSIVWSKIGIKLILLPQKKIQVPPSWGQKKNKDPFGALDFVQNYFEGNFTAECPPVDFPMSDFQKKLYPLVMKIPPGKWVTYGDLAKKMKSKAYQAVGQSLGANPCPLLIPCHRVLGKNDLGGFSAPTGVILKKKLLEFEKKYSTKI